MPIVVLLIAAAVPWVLAMRGVARVPASLSTVILFAMWLSILVFVVAGETFLPLRPLLFGSIAIVGSVGILFATAREQLAFRRPFKDCWRALPAASGAFIWLASLAWENLRAQEPVIAWVMQGDGANNFIFARDVIERGGILVGGPENPAPMTSILLASAALPGRFNVSPSDLALHDLVGFAWLWAFAIAALCLLTGLLVHLLITQANGPLWWVLVGSAAGSLLPLTWYISGYPIDYGFANAPLVLIPLIAAVTASFSFRSDPLIVMTIQTMVASIVLATWSPLVLIPAGLWLLSAINGMRSLKSPRGWRWWAHIVGLGQVLFFTATLALPTLLSQGSALSASGAILTFDWAPSVVLACAVSGLAMVAFSRPTSYEVWVVWVVVAGSTAGLLVLLFLNWRSGLGWTYYPLKLLWVSSALMLILGFAVASGAVARLFIGTKGRLVGAVSVAAVGFLFSSIAAPQNPGYVEEPPLTKISSDGFFGAEGGNEVALAIADLAEPDRDVIFWKTGSASEATLNYWLLKLSVGTFEGLTEEDIFVRAASYGLFDLDDVSVLCDLIDMLREGDLDIYTNERSAEKTVDANCQLSERDVRFLPASSLPSAP